MIFALSVVVRSVFEAMTKSLYSFSRTFDSQAKTDRASLLDFKVSSQQISAKPSLQRVTETRSSLTCTRGTLIVTGK